MIEFLLIITEQALLHLPLILGGFISIALMKLPDLSLEASYLFGAMASAMLLTQMPLGFHPALTLIVMILGSLIAGALVGGMMSIITLHYKIPHLLASIIIIGFFFGMSILVGSSYISLTGFSNSLTALPSSLQHPELVSLALIALMILGSLAYLLRKQIGFSLKLFGDNPEMFHYLPVSQSYVTTCGLLLSSALAGLSGFLMVQSNGFAEINMATGKVLLCLTALILGTVLTRSKRSLLIPIIGTATYFLIQQSLLKFGLSANYFMALQSIIVLIILVAIYRGVEHKKIDHLGV